MDVTSPHLLVLGAGSVGKRHLRNLHELGCRVSAMDPRSDRLAEADSEVPLVVSFASWDEAVSRLTEFDGVVIASPPSFHVEQGVAAVTGGVPVLLEKPVAPTLADAETLRVAVAATPGARLVLGYTYRWWEPLHRLRELLSEQRVGRVRHANFVMSAHLADWHPWEPYSDFFMASRELGGGALLDESHFLDLMYWFFGMPYELFARVERLSDLDIDTDDNVDMIASYADGLRVTMHLDLYGRPHEKYITVTGDGGTLRWSFDPNRVGVATGMEQVWSDEEYTLERNDMFVAVAREFLDVVAGAQPSCTIDDGVEVLRLVEACRLSSSSGASVALREVGVDA